MNIEFEELTHSNFKYACEIERNDIPEAFVDTAHTLMEITDYGIEHHCIGHTLLARIDGKYIGLLLLGEAIPWETDPEEMRKEPFYRLMGFVIDKRYRCKGLGGEILEKAIELVYDDQCHLDKVFYDENSISYAVMH